MCFPKTVEKFTNIDEILLKIDYEPYHDNTFHRIIIKLENGHKIIIYGCANCEELYFEEEKMMKYAIKKELEIRLKEEEAMELSYEITYAIEAVKDSAAPRELNNLSGFLQILSELTSSN